MYLGILVAQESPVARLTPVAHLLQSLQATLPVPVVLVVPGCQGILVARLLPGLPLHLVDPDCQDYQADPSLLGCPGYPVVQANLVHLRN